MFGVPPFYFPRQLAGRKWRRLSEETSPQPLSFRRGNREIKAKITFCKKKITVTFIDE
jgi:hypothetical protein